MDQQSLFWTDVRKNTQFHWSNVVVSIIIVSIVAGMHTHIATTIKHNECFKFNGGAQTKDGHTWYELQDVHGHHVSTLVCRFKTTDPIVIYYPRFLALTLVSRLQT